MNNIDLDRVRSDTIYNLKSNFSNDSSENDDNSLLYNNNGHTCDYFDINDFSNTVNCLQKQISFYSHNVRSLTGKFNEFTELIQSLNNNKFKFTVISITELWNVPSDIQYTLPGYSPLHFSIRDKTQLNNNAGGGVGLWVDSNYSYEPIDKLSVFEPHVFESQFIKLKTSKNKFSIIGNIYRPNTGPQANVKRFIEILDNILQTIYLDPDLKHFNSIELLGDTNVDLLKYNIHGDTALYFDTLLGHKLLPLITLPTRINYNTATLLDHISTSCQDDRYNTGIIISDISDHLPVFYIKHCEPICPPTKFIKSRKINDKTIPVFQELLSSSSWDNILNENRPKYAYNYFFNTIDKHINFAFPETTLKSVNKSLPINPWFTSALIVSRKTKIKLASLKIRKPTIVNIDKYKIYTSIYNNTIRKAKQNYYNDKFIESSQNLRKTWNLIREVIGRKKNKVNIPDYFKNNGKTITGYLNIAEGFNDFFSSIGPELANKIPSSDVHFSKFLGPRVQNNFIFF